MSITRTPWIDDDGTGTTGTIVNNSEKTLLYNQIDQALISGHPYTVVTSTATGTVNNWAPGLNGHTLIAWAGSGASDLTITGLAGGSEGQLVTIWNAAPGILRTTHYATGSSAVPNLLMNWAGSAPTPIAPTGSFTYIHQGGYWRLLAHEQGGWITPPFNAAMFTGSAAPWTVDAADVKIFKYRVSGRTLTLMFSIETTTSTVGQFLVMTIPGSFTIAGTTAAHQWIRGHVAGVSSNAMAYPQNTNQVWCFWDVASATFPVATNNVYMMGVVTIEVT